MIIKITSFKVIPTGYELTVMMDDKPVTVQSYFDIDSRDKVKIGSVTYELVGLSYLKEV